MTYVLSIVLLLTILGLYITHLRIRRLIDLLNMTNRQLNEAREYIAKHEKQLKNIIKNLD